MKRGRPYEMVLALLGVAAWAVIAVFARPLVMTILALWLAALSAIEIIRWQRGLHAHRFSGVRRAETGKIALPASAWFGFGALTGSFLVGLAWGLFLAVAGEPAPSAEEIDLVSFVVSVTCGGMTTWVLRRVSDKRDAAERAPSGTTGRVAVPRPPGGSLEEHATMPLHEVNGPTALLYHLQDAHGARPNHYASSQDLAAMHAELHAERVTT